ncbi:MULTISPECIES: phosphatase PAP2 family protein [Streptomyces]|uniref:phosphatase PAP2 family protein n=1 Tax=Streptomyces TaxID=1883 RepID=UPI001038BA7E|nr:MULTISPECIES: phosphatase PAP2 family protein [Streptomyces]MBT3077889.1 phosphatase PAP2 family protein [Streptomyces sp. COG21]MBT3084732.1 phosphatase PAP2 family protein [Streptomyces sp. COG20]MBT3085544.1 phosphatase PAP2 family protein [Streptomyces sp. CYG21]MBT3103319.1 phosphatase PAP2 family protein [Streptomyces sp. COG19]MBT3107917.1 phosphatase PAP2 family protein [Streptomyces sp. CYG20]
MHSPHITRPAPSPRPTAALAVGIAGTALFVALLALVVAQWSPLMALDRTVADGLHRHALADPGLVRVNRVLTDWFWDPWTMRALVAVAVVVLWWRGARPLALWVAAASLLGSLLQQGVKAAVDRDRPHWPEPVDTAHFAAFPSGHAMTAAVSCGLLLWLLRLYGAGPALWAGAVGVAVVSVAGVAVTRVYLGVHWLTDVVGGVLLGIAVVAFAVAGYAWSASRRETEPVTRGA